MCTAFMVEKTGSTYLFFVNFCVRSFSSNIVQFISAFVLICIMELAMLSNATAGRVFKFKTKLNP